MNWKIKAAKPMKEQPWIDLQEFPEEIPQWSLAGRINSTLALIALWGYLALHVFLTYEAFSLKGTKAAIGTFCLPVLCEVYWCVRFWQLLGPINVVNLGLLIIGLCCFGLLWMPGRFDIITPKFMHYKHWKGHIGEFRQQKPKREPSEIIYHFDQ